MSGIKIAISAIPHANQRYPTAGDWFYEDELLDIRVSSELPRREQFLVAIHELIEAFLCECDGVSQEVVDQFDLNWEHDRLIGEPGDSPMAPYYFQHQMATSIETALAACAGINWLEYSARVEAL